MEILYMRVSDRSKEGFAQSSKNFFKSRYPYFDEPITTSELAISNFKNKYEDSKILVVGGGPTTNTVKWDPAEYDYIFSCNHFFLHPVLSNIEVSFACTSPEVNVQSEPFLSYYNKFNTTFCIANYDIKDEQIKYLISLNKARLAIAELRVKFKIGMGGHLLTLATLFNPREIHFVGIDGYPQNIKNGDDSAHSFELGKKKTGSMDTYEKNFDHHKQLWKYLLDVGKNIKYKNLGHGHPYNILTKLNIGP